MSNSGKDSTTNERLKNNNSDTLSVSYTYWWNGGPFIGMCGDKYALVFTGTVTKIDKPLKPTTVHKNSVNNSYTSQYGVIKINDIKVQNSLSTESNNTSNDYNSEQYFTSDCFYGLPLKEGDKVMVFLYSYEGRYCIPDNSILKIENFNDPIVNSIEKYIKNNQDPLSIRSDTVLWKKYGFDSALKQIIECRLWSQKQ